MSNSNVYTENMADIMACSVERKEVLVIMQAWDKNGLPDNFYLENVRFGYNRNSGCVFLTNDDCQLCMMNGDKLDVYYNSPYDGHEGFLDELLDMVDDHWHEDDIEWLKDVEDNQ